MPPRSQRKEALRRFTLWTGIISTVAGAVIYLQVSGFVTAVGQLAASVVPSDPGAGVSDGGGQVAQPAQPPQYNPGPSYGQQPIAVTGGS